MPELLYYPDPRLQIVCDPVAKEDFWIQNRQAELHQLLDDMWDTVDRFDGWGLSAPQLGAPVRAIVVHVRTRNHNACKIEVVNPKLIVSKRHGKFMSDEGCLSYPGARVMVQRYRKVRVEGVDRMGAPVVFGGKQEQAAALQHEIEHLDGINIADYKKVA